MKDKESTVKWLKLKDAWKPILVGILISGAIIFTLEFFFDSNIFYFNTYLYYSSYTMYGFIALHFAIFSFAFAFFSLTASFIPKSMAAVAEVFPDTGGNAEWHARSMYRLSAISNIGCALIFFACGWMFPYSGVKLWHLFPALFSIGLGIVVICQAAIWIKLEPYRDSTVQLYALKSVLFIAAILAILIYWAYRPFYFDPVAVILLYTICSVAAGLLVGIRRQIAFHRSRK